MGLVPPGQIGRHFVAICFCLIGGLHRSNSIGPSSGDAPGAPPNQLLDFGTERVVQATPRRDRRRTECAARNLRPTATHEGQRLHRSWSLPDPACTPGAVMTMDMNVVCERSTRERRRLSVELHRQAFREYGISCPQPRGAYEVDHLIPLELGGDNTIANLWPESAEPAPGFHQKDKVENFLHRQVRSGR